MWRSTALATILAPLVAIAGLSVTAVTPAFAQTVVYDGSAANPNPAPGANIATTAVGNTVTFKANASAGTVGDAGTATITNSGGGMTFFYDTSTAGSANITIDNTSTLYFGNSSTAANATITNNIGAWTQFGNASTAGSATIINNSLAGLAFQGTSSAGNAYITNNAGLYFSGASTGGNATIVNNNNGTTYFTGTSTGGNASLVNFGPNGVFDFSGTFGPNHDFKISVGYIAGSGTVRLGASQLTLTSNYNTAFSGAIEDGGAYAAGVGSLVKAGTGTLTLSGASSYTGGTEIRGGTIAVTSDANLGGAGGALTFNGGRLETGLTFDSARSVVLSQAGEISVGGHTVLGLTGVVSGPGDLIKTGDGVLRLDNPANAYGNTMVAQSFLLGNADSISGNLGVSSGAFAIFDQASDATFAGNIGGYGGTSGSIGKRGIGTLTLTGTSGLAWGIESGGVVTAAERFTGDATIQSGASLTFNQTANAIYAATLAGDGNVIKSGPAALRYDGDSAGFTGTTTVAAGTLRVGSDALHSGATLGGAITVQNDAMLAGSGTVGQTIVNAGGGIMGEQGQTLTFNDGLTLKAGSSVNVALGQAGGARLFNVSGNLALDGTLNVIDQGGFGAGVYRLFDYTGTLTGNGLAIGAVPNGANAADLSVQTSIVHQVNLLNMAGVDVSFWNGAVTAPNGSINGGAGAWTATGANWTDATGTYPGPQRPQPGFAIFQGTAGAVHVDASAGAIGVTGMQFATDGYTVSGDRIALQGAGGESIIRVGDGVASAAGISATIASELTGSSKLIKSDYGTLVLQGANSYTGGTEIRGGALSISGDANLGAASGGLTFNGGRLATTGNFDTARSITLTQAGEIDVASQSALGLTGVVSGPGDLVKTGVGSLRLDNAGNAYGNTIVKEGLLVGNASSISGNIAVGSAGSVAFEQASDGAFAGDIVGLDGGAGTIVKTGGGKLTLTGASTLQWFIGAGGVVSAAERFGGNALISAGASLTFDEINNASFGGVLAGTGTFTKTGSGTLAYDGNSAGFAGTTDIAAGTLIVGSDTVHGNAVIGGSFNVESGATLGGHGIVGSGAGSLVTVGSGATISPGNSIGTLTVNGDLVFKAGSTYRAEIDPSRNGDLIDVTGTATLQGGTVYALKAGGIYTPGSRWTVLKADGGVNGTFDTLDQNMPFVDLALSYDASRVYINTTRDAVAFCDVAETRNQCETGSGLDSTGGGAVYNALAAVADAATARLALDQLSGEIHASARGALVEDSRFVRDAATDRIRAAFGAVGAPSSPVASYGEHGVSLAAPTSDGLAVWTQGFGAWGHINSDGNAGKLRYDTGGLLIGADAPIFDTWRIGALAGYSRTTFNARDRASSGDGDNYHLGLYGGTQWGRLGFRSGLAYTWHDLDTYRSVAFPGLTDSLRGKYRAGTFQAFGDLGYRIDAGPASFEPFANFAYVRLNTDGFTEQGGAAALHAIGQSTDATFSTLGLRASTGFALGGIATALRGSLGWRHAYGDVTPVSVQAFAGGDAFSVAGVPIAKDAAVINGGIDMAVSRNAVLGISYDGRLAGSAQEHAFKANFNVRF